MNRLKVLIFQSRVFWKRNEMKWKREEVLIKASDEQL